MASKSKKLNAEIRLALRSAFCPPEHAIFFEVAAGTGYEGRRRIADAVAMDMWPSRGMKVTGFEIKVARHDWLREKANPEKAEEIAAYCDRWAIVSAPGIVEPAEMPPAYDWYELTEGGMLTLRQRGSETEAKPLDRSFVASLLRCAGRGDRIEIEVAAEKLIEKDRGRIKDEIKHRVEMKTRAAEHLVRRYEKIEKMVAEGGRGGNLWSGDDEIATAVGIVLKSGVANTYRGLDELSKRLAKLSEEIAGALPSDFERSEESPK